jgi:hypothetical protein
VRIKGILRTTETVSHGSDCVDDSFVGKLCGCGISCHFVVRLLDELLPGIGNICLITMIGSLINEKTNVKVASLIGVVIEKLEMRLELSKERNKPRK